MTTSRILILCFITCFFSCKKDLFYQSYFDLKEQTVNRDESEIIEGDFYNLHDKKRNITKEK